MSLQQLPAVRAAVEKETPEEVDDSEEEDEPVKKDFTLEGYEE